MSLVDEPDQSPAASQACTPLLLETHETASTSKMSLNEREGERERVIKKGGSAGLVRCV